MQYLFADIELIGAAAPAFVQRFAAESLQVTPETQQRMLAACSRRRLLTLRLMRLLDTPHFATLTAPAVETFLRESHQDVARFIVDGTIHIANDDDVSELIDVLAQVQYVGAYDAVLRRADRSSVVRRPQT